MRLALVLGGIVRPISPAIIWAIFCAILWAFGPLAAARAATVPFEATLTVDGQNLRVSVAGEGVAEIDRIGSSKIAALGVPAAAASGASSSVQTSIGLLPDFGALSLDGGNASGVFARTEGGSFRGTMPLFGVLRVCTFVACDDAPGFVPLLPGAIGVPDAVEATTTGALGLRATVSGAAWTTGTVTVTTTTGAQQTRTAQRAGFAHGPASATSTLAQAGGVLQLVTPIVVDTFGITTPRFGMFGTLTLRFVPEPTRGLLFASAAATLLVLGRSRSACRSQPGSG